MVASCSSQVEGVTRRPYGLGLNKLRSTQVMRTVVELRLVPSRRSVVKKA